MKNKKYSYVRRLLLVVIAVFSVVGMTLSGLKVYAEGSSEDEVMEKTLVNGVHSCYLTSKIKGKNDNPVTSQDIKDGLRAIVSTDENYRIYLPSGYGNSVNPPKKGETASVSCYQLFMGVAGLNGGTGFVDGKLQLNQSTVETPFDYKPETGKETRSCFAIRYSYALPNGTASNDNSTNAVCFSVASGGNITGAVNSNTSSTISYTEVNGASEKPVNLYVENGSTINICIEGVSGPTCTYVPFTNNDTKWNDLISKLENDELEPYIYPGAKGVSGILGKAVYGEVLNPTSYGMHNVSVDRNPNVEGSATTGATYVFKNGADQAARSVVKALTGDGSTRHFTVKDKLALYSYYLNILKTGNYGISVNTGDDCTDNKPSGSNRYAIRNSAGKWCEINNINNNDALEGIEFNGISNTNDYLKPMPATQILHELKYLNYDDPSLNDVDIDSIGAATSTEESTKKDTGAICPDLGVLSWIICPVAQLLTDAIRLAYNWIESNFLEIDANSFIVGQTQGNAIFNGWQVFQGFANIVFVIMLIIVILSQVTGFGISNYGIKKALPKLIVVAVLVNLSFLFCQLAVDLSNIFGYGLRQFFEGIANQVGGGEGFSLDVGLKRITGALLLGGGAVATVALANFWKSWIGPFLISLVGILIGVLFFLIILGVRQAGVLILVVISPLAIVCYALPNTKKLFDRWKSMLTSLLLVFPICGALMGGGQLAATIIANAGQASEKDPSFLQEAMAPTLNSNVLGELTSPILMSSESTPARTLASSGIVMATIPMSAKHFAAATDTESGGSSVIMMTIAMFVQVAPAFMVPSITRSSLNSIGNLGNKLSQMGSKWGNRASTAFGKTEAMQDFQRRMEMSRDKGLLERMNRKVEGKSRIGIGKYRLPRRPKDLSQREKRKYAQLSKRRQSMLAEDETAALGVGKSYLEGSEEYETLVNRIRNEQLEKEIKAQRYNINDSDISDNVTALRGALDGHLADLKSNPDDSNKAKVYAHLDQLTSQGDAGMTQVGQAIQAAIANDDLEGAQVMSRYILKNYGKQYKDKQRGTFDMAGDLSRLNLNSSTQVQEFKNKANLNSVARTRKVVKPDGATDTETYAFYTSEYDKHGIDSLDAQRISDINEDSLTRLHELAMTGQLDAQQMASLSRISARALANDANGTGHVQDKLRDKLTDLANIGVGQSTAFARAVRASANTRSDEATRREALDQAKGIARSMTGSGDGWRRLTSQAVSLGSSGDNNINSSLTDVMQDISSNTGNMSLANSMQSAIANDISSGDFSHLQSGGTREVTGINEGEVEYSSDYYENNITSFQSSVGAAASPNLVDGNSDFASMDLSQLERMARQAAYSWNTTTNADGTVTHGAFRNNTAFANQFEYNNVAQGITAALKNDDRFKDPANAQKVRELNKFLAAGGMRTVDPNKLKLPLPQIPKGWHEDGTFHNDAGQVATPTPVQQEDYNQWVNDVVRIQRQNRENGFNDD